MALSNPLSPQSARLLGRVGLPLPSVQARLRQIIEVAAAAASGTTDTHSEPQTAEGAVFGPVGATGSVLTAGAEEGGWEHGRAEAAVGHGEVEGMLELRGEGVFCEYWRRPEATASEFTDDGWFRTGDVAAWSPTERSFRILGRASADIIKSSGFKISALDVERVLLEHPRLAEVAVLGVADERWGERVAAVARLRDPAVVAATARSRVPPGKKRALPPMLEDANAFLEERGGADGLSLEELRAWAEGRMPTYRVPSLLLVLDQIPKNAMGKVNKKELRKLFD